MRFCPAFAFLLAILTAPAQTAPEGAEYPSGPPYVEREEREFQFYPGGKVEISIEGPGSLRIVGWRRGSVRMEAEKIVYYVPEEKAVEILKKSPVRVRHNQTSATLQAAVPPQPPAIVEINLTVFVPGEKTDVTARLSQGSFSIAAVNGWVEATVAQGNMDIASMDGYFSAITRRGDIFAEMSGNRWRGLEFAAITHQGSVELQLPADYSAALQLESREGKITVDYPPRIVDGEAIPPQVILQKKGQLLRATVGEGGAPIKMGTYSGDVILFLKEQAPD